jgi:hypothetical protein
MNIICTSFFLLLVADYLVLVLEHESSSYHTGRFIMFSVITSIYNKKTKGPTLMELFTARGKRKIF